MGVNEIPESTESIRVHVCANCQGRYAYHGRHKKYLGYVVGPNRSWNDAAVVGNVCTLW